MTGRARTTPTSGIYAKVFNKEDYARSIPLIGHQVRIAQRRLVSANSWSASYPVTAEGAKKLFLEADAQPETMEDGKQILRWVYAG